MRRYTVEDVAHQVHVPFHSRAAFLDVLAL
jgi:hypothetical protein